MFAQRLLTTAALATTLSATVGCTDQRADYNPCSANAAIDTCVRDAHDYAGSWPEMEATIDDIMSRRALAGCGVGVMVDDRITWMGSRGFAALPGESGQMTPGNLLAAERFGLHSIGLVASVTKTVTAAAVLEALDRVIPGVDDVDAGLQLTLAELLPDVPEALEDVTVHQLLSHTSGITDGDFSDWLDTDDELRNAFPELAHPGIHPRVGWYVFQEDAAASVQPVVPGISVYENTNYRILGAILDAYTVVTDPDEVDGGLHPLDWTWEDAGRAWYGGGYEAWLRAEFAEKHPQLPLDTLGIHTSWRFGPMDHDGVMARGYSFSLSDEWGFEPLTYTQEPVTNTTGLNGASGSLHMTIGDLTRLMLGLSDGTLVSADNLARMRTVRGWEDDLDTNLGYGLHLRNHGFANDGTSDTFPAWQGAGNKTSDGFAAVFRVVDVDGRKVGAALMCNTYIGLGGLNAEIALILDVVHDTWIATGQPASFQAHTPDPDAAWCPVVETTALDALEVDHGSFLQQTWLSLMAQNRGDADLAERAARGLLLELPDGRDVLAAYDRGDIERAARLLSGALQRLRAPDPTGR